jgi:glutathione S-transferase
MYTLYCRKSAGSVAVEALLEACGATYQTIDLERNPDGSFPAFFHRINPKAEVPALRLPDDSVMTESAAMMIHIADTHSGAGLAPSATAPERAQYLRWMIFLATALYSSDLRLYYPERFTAEADTGSAGIKARAAQTMAQEFDILAQALGNRVYMLGRFSALDIYAAMLVNWAPDITALFASHPNLKAMYQAVTSNPPVAKVWARNGM